MLTSYIHRRVIATMGFILGATSSAFAQPQDIEDPAQYFDLKVAPVLASYCLECHSGIDPKANLDLSHRARTMGEGKDGSVISPGHPEQSVLWSVVAADEMPPKRLLPDDEKTILFEWIQRGAPWGTDPIDPFRFSSETRAGYDWWSLQPLGDTTPPSSADDNWSINEIDHFIRAKLGENELAPSPRADARTLVRRLYINLLGLPAPNEVVEGFAENPSQEAWEQLVDDLLASPHYGERWARHWMDVARFGESGGFEYNTPRENAWHYRDWLIRAFNADLPYDEFARMQLAGDILKPGAVEGAAAVGFLVAGVHNEVLGISDEMKMAGRQDGLEEIAGTVAQTFLGMTVNCARCHDHKFDPISLTEYYQFVSALDGVRHGVRTFTEDDERVSALTKEKRALQQELRGLIAGRLGVAASSANRIELIEPVDANEAGNSYRVSLKLAPTVWADPLQATIQGDGVVVRILGSNDEVIASRVLLAEPWKGAQDATAFRQRGFIYKGTGGGPVRIQVHAHPPSSRRFGGAIDDLRISRAGDTLFTADFDDVTHVNAPGVQAVTEHKVFYGSTSQQWNHAGANAIHSVEHGPGNFALQFFGGAETVLDLTADTPEEKKIAAAIRPIEEEIQSLTTSIFTVQPGTPSIMRVHHRRSVTNLGETVAPAGLKAIGGLSPAFALTEDAKDADRRLKLAEWITSHDNSLFHRVIVNRIWHYHFGRGIVDSPNDFGFSGGRPSHPELLDWLAVWFRDNGYSIKDLHRLIVTSATYQQASSVRSNPTHLHAGDIDKDNRLLWRQNPRRVEGETLRDSMLAVSGTLNTEMFVRSYKDVRLDQVPPANYYIAIDPVGPEFNRRTIYRWHVRGQRSALLDTFDCPDPSVTTPVRVVTTTPSQVLSQWNHPFVLRTSEHLAKRVTDIAGTGVADQVEELWRIVLNRDPDGDEANDAKRVVEEHGLALMARVLLNSNEFIWID